MKQFYFLFLFLLGFSPVMQAQNTVEVDANATWIGYMNVFETPANGGGFAFGNGWAIPDLKSTIDPGAGTVTLQPNFNVWNPADPFWVDPVTGEGNKVMESNTYVEDNSLIGSALTFEGEITDFTIDPDYTVFAFIKVFNADFSILKIETVELTGTGNFSVQYTNVEPEDAVVQYGFQVIGLCADPANEGALGSVVATPPITNSTTIDFDAAAPWIGFMNVFETPANGGGFVFGNGWAVPDLKTVVDAGAGTVTLQPNFNVWNPADPFWVDPVTGEGNKTMEANTFVEDNSLVGSELTWTGDVGAFSIDPAYTVFAFIKVFNADFSVLKIETMEILAPGPFTVNYTNVEPEDAVVQYGFQVIGINADPANEGALGSVVIGISTPPTLSFPIDFEAGQMPAFGDFNGSATTIIANPDASGINTSATVAQNVVPGNAAFAGVNFPIDYDIIGDKFFRMDVWSPLPNMPVLLKLENSVTGVNTELVANTTATNQWEELVWDFSFEPDLTFDSVTIFMNFNVVDPNTQTYFWDNLEQFTPTAPALSFPIDFEAGQMPLFGDFNGSATTIIANPDASGINTSATVAQNVVPGNAAFAGVNFPIDYDIIGDKFFRMDVWSPLPNTPVLLKLENSVTGVNTELVANTTATNQWEELVWDFSFEPDLTFDSVTIFMNFNVIDPNTQTYFWDNLEQFTPMAPPVTFPIDFEAGQMPLFGDFNGSATTIITNPDPSGVNTSDNVAENVVPGNAAFAGVNFPIDYDIITDKYFRMDVWSPLPDMPVLLKLENSVTGVNTEIAVNTTATNEWEELVWDFSFEPDLTFDSITIFMNFNVIDPNTQTYYWDNLEQFTPMAGGPCDLVGPSNGFENGKSFTQNLGRIVAHDFTVVAGEDAMLTEVIANAFIGATGSGVNAAFVDVYVWGDDGGAPDPSNLVASEAGLVPTNQAVVGTNFGFDVWAVTLDIADVMLAGNAGSDTTYWIGLSLEATDASNVFWENSTAGLVGLGEAYDDGTGAGFVIDNTLEGVYTFSAECSPMSGGGGPCDLVGPGNAFENGKSFTQNLGRIVAHDFTVSAGEDSMLTEITANAFIGATGSGVNAAFVDVYIWGDDGGAPDPANLIASEAGLVPSNQAVVGTNFGFDVWAVTLDIADVMLAGDAGSDTTYWIGLSLEATDASNVFWENSTAGLVGLGEAYDDGTGAGFVIDNTLEGVYEFVADCTPISGVTNDECAGATPVACGDVVVGTTADNTDTGGNPAPDEWYSFTGSGDGEIVTVSLCDGGTDYDSLLRVFDACGGNEIATNDDSCGLQSELTFFSDGTTTYYIMIEGFASNSGNFSMAISCVPAAENDQCDDALPITCGETVSGSTLNASFDNAPECVTTNTAPGVWYVYEDTSGLTTDILLSTCSANTDYDTKISVYSGDCGDLVCVNGNDDSANCTDFQSEVEFQSDGNTTYYILVHGFGSAVGNFELSMSCDCLAPANDNIANSNDADEVGFPYVDSNVPAPCATTEDATPPDCDNAGVQGFWYNFTPEMDGLATCEVTAPAGFTSVTFYEAPSESATEDELILIDYFDNQCVPQNDASVPVVAGQAYYVYVANTGGVTDVVIDGTFFLGANDNQIEGFTFAPNPAANNVTLAAQENIEQVQLFNVIGQKVMDLSINAPSQTLDVSNLAAGAYIMQVSVNGKTGTYKLIKQ